MAYDRESRLEASRDLDEVLLPLVQKVSSVCRDDDGLDGTAFDERLADPQRGPRLAGAGGGDATAPPLADQAVR